MWTEERFSWRRSQSGFIESKSPPYFAQNAQERRGIRLLRCSRGLWINAVEGEPGGGDHHETQDAAFGTDTAAGQPSWALQRGAEQVPAGDRAAVGNGIEEGFAPVPGGVESDREPQIPGAAQGKAKE